MIQTSTGSLPFGPFTHAPLADLHAGASGPVPGAASKALANPSAGDPEATFGRDLLASSVPRAFDELPIEEAVDCVVDECFFTVGQTIGTTKTLEANVVRWWRDHYRAMFLRAMSRFGNRWRMDREKVVAVGRMLGKRTMRYASERRSIDLSAAKRATDDMERYCTLHAQRHARGARLDSAGDEQIWIAGYWCVPAEPVPTGPGPTGVGPTAGAANLEATLS